MAGHTRPNFLPHFPPSIYTTAVADVLLVRQKRIIQGCISFGFYRITGSSHRPIDTRNLFGSRLSGKRCGQASILQRRKLFEMFVVNHYSCLQLIALPAEILFLLHASGIPFQTDIAKNINGKSVVCFLKYIDRKYMGNAVRDYPIVKIYIQGSNVVGADLPHTETASSKPESLPAVLPTQSLRATDQLFSPTTKKVLDEIATSAEDVGDLNKATTVKKCLKFQEACPLIPAMNNNQPAYQPVTQQMDIMPPSFPTLPNSKDSADVVLQEGKKQVLKCSPVEASDAYGSPVKKLKTKEKLN